jgi:hypothetical protein
MSYLERNSRLLSEIGANVTFKPGEQRGESRSLKFSSVGSYPSEELGTDVYVGVKEPKEKSSIFMAEQLRQRFIFELAVMSVIAENIPHLLPELPLFYGLLTDKDGEPMAIVTEDFSRNGQDHVSSHAAEPYGFRELFVEDTLEDDFVCNIGFTVYPKVEEPTWPEGELPPMGSSINSGIRRLGDFYPLVPFHKRALHSQHFPEAQIEEDLDKYSLKTDTSTKPQ